MPPTLSPQKFVAKWSQIRLKEMTVAQSHFIDVCALVNHLPPLDADPHGQFFTFEASTEKTGGQRGRADVWYKGRFIWEYKGARADLDKAYQQLLLYRESLGNPPLLITSDTQRIIIHTNFTNTVKRVYEIDFERLLKGDGLALLKRAFHDPQSLEPDQTQEQVTRATANTFVAVVDTLKKWERAADPERLGHFIVRLFFCLFAEDLGLLPGDIFTQLVGYQERGFRQFVSSLRALFAAMRDGGTFGFYPIRHFDGGLFDDDYVPDLPSDIMDALLRACRQDWSGIDPSIFGTLFERVIDEAKRAQLGAHYTSKDDIMLIVEPVLMKPLRDRWYQVKREATRLIKSDQPAQAHALLNDFAAEIAAVRVLDPACGSGNFLYVALRQLLDLQKEVIVFARRQGLDEIPLTAGPEQLYGIEIDPYAHELAQITVWIGYLQWRFENGFAEVAEPVLRPLANIQRKDAVLAYDADDNTIESEWPEADVVVSNPPFLGTQKMRKELGDDYVDKLRRLYQGRLWGKHDLVCFWFENARAMIEKGKLKRAGLIATNSIRQGASRHVLERIKETGGIFMAWSDHPWKQDGAAVRVSIVGFDDGSERTIMLNGKNVKNITANLRSGPDLTKSVRLKENEGIAFYGTIKGGPFDIDVATARTLLAATNASSRSNEEVVKPWVNGTDITRRPRNMWIIDFGVDMPLEEAELYEMPFEYVHSHVKPMRDKVRRKKYREKWWLFSEPCVGMRQAIAPLSRFIVTTMIAKYRLFAWLKHPTIPDQRVVVIARGDDYFFGVLHSRVHESWALAMGSTLEDRPSYAPTATFQTFLFPWSPGQEPGADEDPRVAAIAEAARELVAFRQAWLHPEGVGIIISERQVKKRTLTNLYNALVQYRENVRGKDRNPHRWKEAVGGIIALEEIETLDHIHNELDQAVFDAYGWPHGLSDEEILERLLALNLERAVE